MEMGKITRALEDEPWFRRVAGLTKAVRFLGFSAMPVLVVWLFGWITLPSWLVWVLAALALFTIVYSVFYSVAVHRAQNLDASAVSYYAAAVAVWVFWAFWAVLVAALVWWWVG